MALSDGAHMYGDNHYPQYAPYKLQHILKGAFIYWREFWPSRSTEEFSYFTLRRKETATEPATSLFGISCARQIDSNLLLYRPSDVTRSTVQKAVVVITDSPQSLGQLREKLSIVASAWFAQRYVETNIHGLLACHNSTIYSLRWCGRNYN